MGQYGIGQRNPTNLSEDGHEAGRWTWRGRPCGPDCTRHPHTQGLQKKSLMIESLCMRITTSQVISGPYSSPWHEQLDFEF